MTVTTEPAPHPRDYTAENTFVMLLDHQRDPMKWVKNRPPEVTIAACRVLARIAEAYGMPLLITTTMEDEVGTTIPEIQEVAPHVVAAAAATGRKKIVVVGITSDICVFWSTLDALKLGYEVLVVADGCGTMSELGETVSWQRLREVGAIVTVTNQIVTELANDLDAPQGRPAKQIMTEEVISRMSKQAA
jgi:nicotinamidase-related amidase